MVNYAVVGGAMIAYLATVFFLTLPDVPVAITLFGAVGLVLIVAAGFFPFSKTVWSAIELKLRGRTD